LGLSALLVGAVLLAPFFVFVTLFRDGVGYQGRYAMALTQAVPVLAGAILARRALPVAVANWWRFVPGLVLGLGLIALTGSALRYAVGLPLPSSPVAVLRAVAWVPPAWPLVIALLALAGWLTALLSRELGAERSDRIRPRASMTR
ncbi:MAG: hypothetical protein H7323_02305, partial [Frankiales bacterium]|nr:hypothetical protein [Frankiales bacterium]